MTIQYDPQKVTDWLTPLEKVYDRQSQQLDRYHSQLRERDRQEEAATLDLPEMFGKLASFSKTIGQVVEARATNQQKKTDFDWNQFSNPDQIRLEKLVKEGSVIDDHNEFMKTIANDITLSPSAKLSLKSKSGAYFHRLRKTIGFQKVNNAYRLDDTLMFCNTDKNPSLCNLFLNFGNTVLTHHACPHTLIT